VIFPQLPKEWPPVIGMVISSLALEADRFFGAMKNQIQAVDKCP
jgi:hypothetical protein